jgi:hypothetical protein
MLRNGDRLAGKVHQYVDGNVWLAIEGRPNPIPLAMARVSGIFFDSSPKTVPRRYARDVRVTAHAGMTRVTGRLSQANEMSLDLQSEIWGELRAFPMSDVELIQFNPYLPMEAVWQKPSQPLPHLP